MLDHAMEDEFYQVGEEKIPLAELPEALLNTSVGTYAENQFYFFNGTKKVKFSTVHLEGDSSFMARAKKLSLGNFRAQLFQDIVVMIRDRKGIELDEIETRYGREKLRELLQKIHDSGYSEGLTLNSLLELDRINDAGVPGQD